MAPWLALHLLSIGIWIGCILVEVLFEHAIPKQGDLARTVAGLHAKVDLAVEVPAFLATLLTGLVLLGGVEIDGPMLLAKVAAGTLAVAINAWCVWLVLQRHRYAARGDMAGFWAADKRQHAAGGLLVAVLTVPLAIGLVHAAG
jgi:hypothetical protein